MLKSILALSGKPGLYKLISRGKNLSVVESLADHKRMPVHAQDKSVLLGDISIYTDADDVPLSRVLTTIREKENGAPIALDLKKATPAQLSDYMASVLPSYDRARVYHSDIKKLISWYNLLISCGITSFEEPPVQETDQPE
ncbi:MAG: DUF5606 domain-containing protein [Prevotellaceae bacterium]|jgi:hypothetical protein|nr:DUF5606 domain-containing protein [Prevotellaceae bacterium]